MLCTIAQLVEYQIHVKEDVGSEKDAESSLLRTGTKRGRQKSGIDAIKHNIVAYWVNFR